MDRRTLALVLLGGCAAAAAPLSPGEIATTAPVGAEVSAVASRGAIGYRSRFLGTRLLLSVELGLRFELAIRRIDSTGPVDIGRLDLGPPDWDITALAAPATGPRVWVGSMDGTVRQIDVGRQRIERTFHAGQSITAAAVSADGRYLVYGTDRGVVCLRRTRDGALLQCMRAHDAPVSALAVGGEPAALVSASWNGEVARFSLPALRRLGGARAGGAVNDLALRGDLAALAISDRPAIGDRRRGGATGSVVVVDLATGGRRQCRGHRGPVTAVDWTAGGELLSGSWDRTVRQWRLDRDRCRERWRRSLGGHQITSLASGPRGRYVGVSLWITALDQPGSLLLRYLYPPAR